MDNNISGHVIGSQQGLVINVPSGLDEDMRKFILDTKMYFNNNFYFCTCKTNKHSEDNLKHESIKSDT